MRGIKRLIGSAMLGVLALAVLYFTAPYTGVYIHETNDVAAAERGGIRCAWRAGRDAARFAEPAVNV